MSSKLKTSLIAATIAFSVGLFSLSSAHAGGRHHIRIPLSTHVSGYDADGYASSYGCEVCGHDEETAASIAAAAVAAGVASRALGVDVEDVLDLLDE